MAVAKRFREMPRGGVFMRIYDIRINGAQPGLLMPASGLRFSWKTEADCDGFYQKAYRITLSGANGTVFDTGRVESGISVDTPQARLLSEKIGNVAKSTSPHDTPL